MPIYKLVTRASAPAVLEARRIIERGVIGEIILTRSTRVSRRPPRVGDVGVIKDLAIHERADVVVDMSQGDDLGTGSYDGVVTDVAEMPDLDVIPEGDVVSH